MQIITGLLGAACIIAGVVLLFRAKKQMPGFSCLVVGVLLVVFALPLANTMSGFKLSPKGLEITFYQVKPTEVYTTEQLNDKTIQAEKSLLSTVRGTQPDRNGGVPPTEEEKGETFELFHYLRDQGYIPVSSLSAAADFEPGSIVSVSKDGELHPVAAVGEAFQNLHMTSTPVTLPSMAFSGNTKSGYRKVEFVCKKATYEATSVNSLQNNLVKGWREKLEQDKSLYVVYGVVSCDELNLDYVLKKMESGLPNEQDKSLHATTKQVLGIKLASLRAPN